MSLLSEPIMFADNTSVIISTKKFHVICTVSNLLLSCIRKWLAGNRLVLSPDKMNVIKFVMNTLTHYALSTVVERYLMLYIFHVTVYYTQISPPTSCCVYLLYTSRTNFDHMSWPSSGSYKFG